MASTRGRRLEVEGETIDEAIDTALAALAISRDQAEVEIVQDARRGVFGFGGQRARVRVSARTTALADACSTVASPAQPQAGEPESLGEAAEILGRLLELMGLGDARIDRENGEDGDETGEVSLRISSEAGGLLIGRHGQTLDALEYVVNRIVERKTGTLKRIVLDAEGYRERRRRELIETALRLAARVRETGRPMAMNPSTARERRIVHMALANDARLSTRSDGDGALRHVVIFLRRSTRNGAGSRRTPSPRSSSD